MAGREGPGRPGKPRRAPEGPGKPRRAPEGPGEARRAPEDPGRPGRPGRPGKARKTRKTRGGPEAPESLGSPGGPGKGPEAPEAPGRPGRPGEARKPRKTRERPGRPRKAPEGPRRAPEGPGLQKTLPGNRRGPAGLSVRKEAGLRGQAPGLPVHGLRRAGAGIAGARPAEGRRRDCRCTACGGQASPLFPTPPQAGCGQGGCGLAPVQGRLSASLKQVPGCLKGRCPATWVHERAEIAPNRAQRQRPAASGRSRGDCPQVQGQNIAARRFFLERKCHVLCLFDTDGLQTPLFRRRCGPGVGGCCAHRPGGSLKKE